MQRVAFKPLPSPSRLSLLRPPRPARDVPDEREIVASLRIQDVHVPLFFCSTHAVNSSTACTTRADANGLNRDSSVLTPLDTGQIGAVALHALTVSLAVLVLRGPLVVQDVGMIDSESPRTAAERKAALRRQQQLLREDIENLHSRALLQVPSDP